MTVAQFVYVIAWIGAIGWPIALFLVAWRRAAWCGVGVVRAAAALVTLFWMFGVWAFLIEPKTQVVRRVTIESLAWTGAPLTIGVISDVHVGGPHVSVARVRRIVGRMNAEAPDLVLLVGDYVDHHRPPSGRSAAENAAITAGLEALGEFEAPLGVVAVLGNHDWWYDGPLVEATLRAVGVTVLENDAVSVGVAGRTFWIAGLADYDSKRAQPSFDRALTDVPEAGDVIAIGHWPDVFAEAPPRVALTLAGHSHCGQLSLPIIGRPFAVSPGSARWPCGAYEEGGRQLFVTGGVGTSVLPARFGAPPEIVILMLVAAPPA